MKKGYHISFWAILGIGLTQLFVVSCSSGSQEESGPVTYSKDIAPIMYQHCTTCHRPGEAGPFDLVTYQDAVGRGNLLKFVTKSRFMPPWPADPNYVHFIGENVLSDEEIKKIGEWVDQGFPIGDSTAIPALPNYPTGSQLGKPDLVVKFKTPYHIKGDGLDKFLLMRVPFELPHDTFVSVVEIVPGNRKLVHHVNAQLLSYDFDKRKDVFKGNTIVDIDSFPDKLQAYKALDLPNDDGVSFPTMTTSVTNYLPGVTPPMYPDGIGGFVFPRKGAFFLKDMHYGPTRVDTSDLTSFNVFFSKTPPRRPTQEFQLGTFGVAPVVPRLSIPADSVMRFTSDYKVPFDLSILTVNPHMHLLGRSFWAYALTEQGDTIPLIRINKWDFRWQYFYTYQHMLKIPKGAVIHAEGIYDNTRNNPYNPFSPPQLVEERDGSMRTSDEMFQFIITYLPYQPGDENISLLPKQN